ncbi:MAG: 3-oxoacyl-[acyl-carrier-protein] reductase [Candidatus Omnitrophica bacterium]|nr:3-oxoacyl-[acyl-carrier-protein] reductase [Candidatus Omnitrophota bacterium]
MILKDKVALVTGAGQGIGKEITLAFAREGADVAVCDVNLEQANLVKQEVEKLGRNSEALQVDVTKYAQVEEATNKILDKFKRIDILVNNAGITKDNLILRLSESDWDAVISVNLKGSFNVTKAVSRPMIKQRSGKMINIAFIIGIIGNAGQANYAASKAGIIALTKTTAKELASRNINVNAVAPGFIQTAMTDKLPEDIKAKMLSNIPLGRLGTTRDIANICLFLASEDSNYITGQTIVVDGGMVMA